MKKGDKYKLTADGVSVFPDYAKVTFTVSYVTPRVVVLSDELGEPLHVLKRNFDALFQEVKPRGRKAASSK